MVDLIASFGCSREFASRIAAAAANLEITKSLLMRLAVERFLAEVEGKKEEVRHDA